MADNTWARDDVPDCSDDDALTPFSGALIPKFINNYAPQEEAFSLYEEVEGRRLWVTCNQRGVGLNNITPTINNIVVTEFMDNYFGLSGRKTSGDYHTDISRWQNSFGQLNMIIMKLNGIQISGGYGSSDMSLPQISEIKPNPKTLKCKPTYDRQRYAFGDIMEIVQSSLNSGLKMRSFMFRNADTLAAHKKSGEVQYTMEISPSDVGGCGMEVEFQIPVKTTGGMEIDVMLQQQSWLDQANLQREWRFRNKNSSNSTSVEFSMNRGALLKDTLAYGESFKGNADVLGELERSRNLEDRDLQRMLSVSKQFVCAEGPNRGRRLNASVIRNPDPSVPPNRFIFSVSPEEAPASCLTLFWDPVLNPVGCPEGASMCRGALDIRDNVTFILYKLVMRGVKALNENPTVATVVGVTATSALVAIWLYRWMFVLV